MLVAWLVASPRPWCCFDAALWLCFGGALPDRTSQGVRRLGGVEGREANVEMSPEPEMMERLGLRFSTDCSRVFEFSIKFTTTWCRIASSSISKFAILFWVCLQSWYDDLWWYIEIYIYMYKYIEDCTTCAVRMDITSAGLAGEWGFQCRGCRRFPPASRGWSSALKIDFYPFHPTVSQCFSSIVCWNSDFLVPQNHLKPFLEKAIFSASHHAVSVILRGLRTAPHL